VHHTISALRTENTNLQIELNKLKSEVEFEQGKVGEALEEANSKL